MVSVVRALLKVAALRLINEATRALDNQNQNLVTVAIMSQAGKRTISVVAHQLNMFKDADYIIFLEHGDIIESDMINQLILQNGHFAQYCQHRRV